MNRFILLLLLVLFTASSSAQKKKDDHVLVCEENVPVPVGAKYIGKIRVMNEFTETQISQNLMMKNAMEKVLRRGGNVLKVTRYEIPGINGKKEFRIWGDVYKVDDADKAAALLPKVPDSISLRLLSDTSKYALLFIYEPILTGTPNCNLYLNGKSIYDPSIRYFDTVKVYKEGHHILSTCASADTLNIKFGKAYFICYWPVYSIVRIVRNPYKGYKEFKCIADKVGPIKGKRKPWPKQYEDY
ncbi:MAG: hypothetical protein JST70_04800 [Bacteroidetes bacterium]|nr:hypothetical protein [Bacteroidota bacterium]